MTILKSDGTEQRFGAIEAALVGHTEAAQIVILKEEIRRLNTTLDGLDSMAGRLLESVNKAIAANNKLGEILKDTNRCECADWVPVGYLCGKPDCPRTKKAEESIRKIAHTLLKEQPST